MQKQDGKSVRLFNHHPTKKEDKKEFVAKFFFALRAKDTQTVSSGI